MKIDPKKIKLKNGKNFIIRSASAEDAENILQHLQTTHAESYKNLNQSADFWKKALPSEQAQKLATLEASPSNCMLVALFEDRIIGGIGFWGNQAEFVKHSGNIGMSIQSEFSGYGLGSEMLNLLFQVVKEHGFRRIELTVRVYNAAGIRLYEKVGFERVGLLKDAAFIDGQYVDEYSYQKILIHSV